MALGEELLRQIHVTGSPTILQPGERFRLQIVAPPFVRPPVSLADPTATGQGWRLDVGTLLGTFAVNGPVDLTVQPLFNALRDHLTLTIGTAATAPGTIAGALTSAATDISLKVTCTVLDADNAAVDPVQYRVFPITPGEAPSAIDFLFKPLVVDDLAEAPRVAYTIRVDVQLKVGSEEIDTANTVSPLHRLFEVVVLPLRLPAILLLGSHKHFDAYGSPKLSTGKKQVAGMLVVLMRYGSSVSGDTPETTLNNLFARIHAVLAVVGTLGDLAGPLLTGPAGARVGLRSIAGRVGSVPTVFAHCGNVDDLSRFRKGTWIGALIKFVEGEVRIFEYQIKLLTYVFGFFFRLVKWLGRAVKKAVQLKKLPSPPAFHPPSMPPFPVLPLPETFLYEASSLMLFGLPGTSVGLYATVDFVSPLTAFSVPGGACFTEDLEFTRVKDRCASVRFSPGKENPNRLPPMRQPRDRPARRRIP